MDKVKVCCFCETWESGGIESFLNNVIGRLDPERFQIDIVAASLNQSVFTELLQRRGVRFIQLSGRRRSLIANQRQFLALLCKERYHVVHLNLYQGLSLAYAWTSRRAGVSVRIAHSHNTALCKSAAKPLKLLIHNMGKHIFARDATQFWACSVEAAKFLFPKGLLKRQGYRFIPNGIEVKRFRFDSTVREQIRMELGIANRFVVGNVGRLCNQKNQDFLLNIFAQVKQRNPESSLLLVGEGELLGYLKAKAKQLKIADSVIFYGAASRVEQLLWAMDVFVLPSRFEGLPLTGIEAQIAGLPCFFSDAVTRESSIVSSTVFLPLKAKKEVWADAILDWCGKGLHRLSANTAGSQMFSANAVMEKIHTLYIDAIEASQKRAQKC